MQPNATDDYLISLHDVRRMTGVSRQTIWRLRRKGQFPEPVRVGSLSRWWHGEVIEWMKQLMR